MEFVSRLEFILEQIIASYL